MAVMGEGVILGVMNLSPTFSLKGRGFSALVSGDGDFMRNDLQHPVNVPQHIAVPEADHAVAVGFNDLCSAPVGTAFGVLPTVQFNGDTQPAAREIDYEAANLALPREFHAAKLAGAQVLPQQFFRFCRVVAQFSREAGQSLFRHRGTPIPNPFPAGKGLSVAKLS
ncbi:hypothetical protein [Alteraurantiacibacter palmitatis]